MQPSRRSAYLKALGITQWRSRHAVAPGSGSLPPAAGGRPLPASEATPPRASEKLSSRSTDAVPAAPVSAEPEMPAWLLEEPPLEDLEPVLPEGEEHPGECGSGLERLDWEGLQATVSLCEACVLHQGRKQTVFGVGHRQADLLVLGEAPGAEEDRQGEPFVGRAGQLLTAMLQAIGLGRDQVFIANILKCRPPQNRDPRPEEVVSCNPYLQRQIELLQPKLILCVGRVAAQNLLKSDLPVGKLRGKEWRHRDIPVRVSYHPAYLLRSPAEKAKVWQDLQWVAAQLKP